MNNTELWLLYWPSSGCKCNYQTVDSKQFLIVPTWRHSWYRHLDQLVRSDHFWSTLVIVRSDHLNIYLWSDLINSHHVWSSSNRITSDNIALCRITSDHLGIFCTIRIDHKFGIVIWNCYVVQTCGYQIGSHHIIWSSSDLVSQNTDILKESLLNSFTRWTYKLWIQI